MLFGRLGEAVKNVGLLSKIKLMVIRRKDSVGKYPLL